jgi:hypothetical protein
MRGSSRPGNDYEACPACGEVHTARGLGVHMASAHGVVHRRSDEGRREPLHYRADQRPQHPKNFQKNS